MCCVVEGLYCFKVLNWYLSQGIYLKSRLLGVLPLCIALSFNFLEEILLKCKNAANNSESHRYLDFYGKNVLAILHGNPY
uniref:Uncharacterized protein n=1 Tax=Rhizophora mucronata TaxID=61149 RepID=A0A2P2LDW0_RHIMU